MQPIRKYDICTSKESNGKKYFKTVGEIAVWQSDKGERLSLEMYAQPDTDFAVFEKKPRQTDEQPAPVETSQEVATAGEEINLEDVKF